jgi:head-tail adaptor
MKAGRMRQRLRFEKPPGTPVRDGFESPTKTFVVVKEQDAEVTSVTGREFFGSDRELGELTWRITFRSIPDEVVEPNWRGVDVDTGAVYDFVAILPSRQRDFVVVAAKSGSSFEQGAP